MRCDSRGRGVPVVAAILAVVVAAHVAGAQAPTPPPATQGRERDCDVQFRGVKVKDSITSHFESRTGPGGRSNDFAGGGVDAVCLNSDQRVTSDSAEHYGDARVVYLIGRVHYTETKVKLDADRITYFLAEERLVAEGNVVGRTSTGTRFSGPRAVYLRARAGLRQRSRLDAGGRPETWVSGTDAGASTSGGSPADSVHILADSLISDNDSLVYARGKVVIERHDIIATADSAMMDQGKEIAALRRGPKVVGRGDHAFTLTGAMIDLYSRHRQTERVRSAGAAKATSDDIRLDADTIDLRVADQKLSRAIAWGPTRAKASQPARDIVADSVDVDMPGQVIRRMVAVRHARAETVPDSTQVRVKARDWLSGDTITAVFDSVAAGDTAKPVMRSLTATGDAHSFQHGARSGVALPDTSPAMNYMMGRKILAEFAPDRSLERLRVFDQVFGILAQPATDSTARKAKADSAKAKADTTKAKPAPEKRPPPHSDPGPSRPARRTTFPPSSSVSPRATAPRPSPLSPSRAPRTPMAWPRCTTSRWHTAPRTRSGCTPSAAPVSRSPRTFRSTTCAST